MVITEILRGVRQQSRWTIAILMLTMAACGGSSSTPSGYTSLPATGSAEAGKAIYDLGFKSAQACAPCHELENIGPPLKGIATRAANRVQGQSADEYLYNSIVNPSSIIVPGYNTVVMPDNYGKALSQQQIRDVITYLMTLQ